MCNTPSSTHSPGQAPLQHSPPWVQTTTHPLSPATYSFDVPPLGRRAGQAEAYHVHEQTRDAQQVHGIPDEGRGDDVVDEESPIVWQEHTPGEMQQEQAARGAPSLQGSSWEPPVPLGANKNHFPL